MKKLTLLLVLAMSTIFAMAQNGRIDLRHESKAEIVKSDFSSLRATFSYGSIESIELATERGTFSEIAIEGTYASGEIGTPQLPASHQLLAVPFGATPRVSVTNYTTTDYRLSDYGINTLVPRQVSVRKDQRPEDIEFAYNASAYQTRSLATAPEATIEVQGTMRGIQIGSLVINPVSYNPAANTLRVFNDIEVEVRFDGADLQETERMLLSTYSPYFDIVYKQMFNYRAIQSVYDDHPDLMAYPVHMMVIAPQNYVNALEPWVNWKIQKGFDVSVYTTAETGSTYGAIRSFVQNQYNTGVNQGKTPTFLVIVGDVAQVANTTGNQTQKVTDLYYGTVDNDYFPDMFYSRMSAENTTQLTNIINKILQYEQYTMPDPSYLNNVTLIAGWDSYWTARVGRPTINYATTYYYNAEHGFNTVNSHVNQSQYPGCYNALNTGVGFVNYTAHGYHQEWSDPQFTNSNVNQLTNANKYFLAMGNCCLSGNFGYSGGPCFGEAMIRGENKAAYSYIGSCPNTYWYEDYYFGVGATNTFSNTPNINNTATGVYDGVWMDDTYNTVSSMTFLGNIAVCYAHAGNYQTSSNQLYYWQAYHVLGDGSIMPYRVNPTANNVNHAATFPSGTTSFQVSAQEGSYVAISQNNVLKGTALVPASGTVSVPVEAGITSGQVRIVVTKPQRQPYIQDINVSGAVTQYTVSVSANPTEGGTVEGGGTFNQGTSCTVSASANEGYDFVNWTEGGTVVSTNANYTFNVTANRTLVANFEQQIQTYTITATANPTNGGTVTGAGTFNQGESCTLQATPSAGYTFVRWTKNGQQVSTNAQYTFTVTETASYVAHFQVQTYTITATANPINGGTVTGGGTFNYNASCTLTATPASGYTFLRWTKNGTQVSTNPIYTFNVTESANYVAHFQAQSFTITATANPTNGGTVTGGGSFTYGQSCTLTATAAPGYVFEKWTKNGVLGATTPSCTFTVVESAEYVAHFIEEFSITLSANPTEGGHVAGDTHGTYGQTVCARAFPNEGYEFLNWTENGEVVYTGDYYVFVITSNRNLVANFSRKTYTIVATADPVESATITGSGTFDWREEVTVSAIPNEDWTFLNWTENGVVVSEELSYTFTIEYNRNLVAHFQNTVGLAESNIAAKVFPNPTSGEISVTCDGLSHIRIINAYGQTVYNATQESDQAHIDLSQMAKGIYMMHIEANGGQVVKKIVVK